MRISRALAVVLLLSCSGRASAESAAGAEAFDFLNLDANARAVGLGGAYTALSADANALLYNPAGLGRVKAHELTFMHNQSVQGLSQQYMGFASKQGVGASLNYLHFGDITRTRLDARDGTLGSFGITDLALSAGYGHSFFDGAFSAGGAFKYLRESIDDVNANGYAFDGGVLASVSELPGLTFGASLMNMGPGVRFVRDRSPLPVTGRAGAAYGFTAAGTQNTLAFDMSKQRTDKLRMGVGGETVLGRVMALRVGFNTRNQAGIGVTGGVGFLWRTLGIDYAFSPYGDLGLAHRISLTFRWGSDEEQRPKSERVELMREALKPKAYTLEQRFERADRFLAGKSFDDARTELSLLDAQLPQTDQRRVRYHERLGQLHFASGDCAKAKSQYVEALKLAAALGFSDPSVADAYFGLGRCLRQQGNASYALKFMHKALESGASAQTRLAVQAELEQLRAAKP